MKSLYQIFIILTTSYFIVACSGSNSSSTTTPSSTSWQAVGSTLPWYNVSFNTLAISSSGNVFAGGTADVNNGLVVANTAESGAWQITGNAYIPNLPTGPNPAIIQVDAITTIANTNIVYAAVSINHQGSVVYKNTGIDGAWESINTYATPDAIHGSDSVINAIATNNSRVVYVATAGYNINTNVYFGNVYSNTGVDGTWQLVGGSAMPDGGVANSLVVANNGTVYVASGGINVNNLTSYFGDVYSNTGSGGVWQQQGGGSLPDGGVANSIVISNDGSTIYVGSSVGHVYGSTANGRWTAIGGGAMPDAGAINAIAISNTGIIYSATSNANIFATTITSNWQLIGGGAMPDGWFINAIATYQNKVYAATQNGNTYVTTNNK